VGLKIVTIDIVATDEDPGGNNVFDSLSTGRIEGINTSLDCDFKAWVRKQHRHGRTFLTVYEID